MPCDGTKQVPPPLPVIDDTCIAETKLELPRLVRFYLAQQVVRYCLVGGDNYYDLYNDCKLYLVRTGRQAGIDDDTGSAGIAPIDQYEYEQLLMWGGHGYPMKKCKHNHNAQNQRPQYFT
jgi:hypothetical protein